jgi:uncharacterized integral membrane protein
VRVRRRLDSPEVQEWQPRLWAILIGLLVVGGYVIAFIVENSRGVKVHWVFGTSRASLIWLIIVSLAIGVLIGVLVSQLYRRRWRLSHTAPEDVRERDGEPPDTVGDPGG